MKKPVCFFILTLGTYSAYSQGGEVMTDSVPAGRELILPELSHPLTEEGSVVGNILPSAVSNKLFYPRSNTFPHFGFNGNTPVADGTFTIRPYGYNFSNPVEGADIAGLSAILNFNRSSYFYLGGHVSSGYFGHWVPERVWNATLNLGFDINVTENLSIQGWGYKSLKEGIDPAFHPSVGPSNCFGVGASYKVNDIISLQGAYDRVYYKGKRHDNMNIVPGLQFRPKKKSKDKRF